MRSLNSHRRSLANPLSVFFLTQAIFIDFIVSQPSNWLGRRHLRENSQFISGSKSHEAHIWHSEPWRRSAMSSIRWLLSSGFGQVLLMSRLERFIQDTFVCLSLRLWSPLCQLSKLPEILVSFFHFVLDVKGLIILIDRRFGLGRILLDHEITYKYWRVIYRVFRDPLASLAVTRMRKNQICHCLGYQ
jgi:hypothetical protein